MATAAEVAASQPETLNATPPAKIEAPPKGRAEIGGKGIRLETTDDVLKLAQLVAGSDLAPKDFKGKVGNCVVAIQLGMELGLPPMAALQNIAVINGRPGLWGDAQLAVCQCSGIFDYARWSEKEVGTPGADDWGYCTTCARVGQSIPTVHTFTVADAKVAGLWGKDIWKKYPKRMLQMRARGFSLRDTFADVLKGMYSVEELTGTQAVERVLSQIELPADPDAMVAEMTAKPPGEQASPATPAATEEVEPAGVAPPAEDGEVLSLRKQINEAAKAWGSTAKTLAILQGHGVKSQLALGKCVDVATLTAIFNDINVAMDAD